LIFLSKNTPIIKMGKSNRRIFHIAGAPGSGKTYIGNRHKGTVVDTDDIIKFLYRANKLHEKSFTLRVRCAIFGIINYVKGNVLIVGWPRYNDEICDISDLVTDRYYIDIPVAVLVSQIAKRGVRVSARAEKRFDNALKKYYTTRGYKVMTQSAILRDIK
jgi:hypothetical protein